MFRGPTKYSEYIQDVPKSIDFILKRVNAVTVSDLQAVTQAGATTTLPINTGGITSDYFQLDTTATPTLVPGMFGWNDAYGTADLRLKGNNVTLQLGQETLARVVNKTGSDLLESEYKVVRVRIASEGGAQGQRLAVVLAQGLNDPDSATTLGIVTETIPNNQEGFITVFGNVNNINTTGSLQGETWADGDVLYLSPTIAGGLTKVKPIAPQHMVVMGYVVYAHAINGKIFVKVDNGYELDELHNVLITSPANNDLLQYNSAQQVWKNVASSVAVPTPTLAQVTTAGNTTTNAITVGGLTVGQVVGNGVINFPTSTSGFATSIYSTYAGNSLTFQVGSRTLQLNGGGQLNTNFNTTITGSTGAAALIVQQGNAAWSPVADFNGSAGTALRVNTNGNILIGTTTDAGYKLDVNGTARIQGVITGSVGGGAITLGAAAANQSAISINGYFTGNGAIITSNANGRSFNSIIGAQNSGIISSYNGNAQGQTIANHYFLATGNINLTDGAIDLNAFAFTPTIVSETGATIKAFSSTLTAASNHYNLYLSGTAQNYLAGNVGIGLNNPQGATHIAVASGTPALVLSDVGSPNTIPTLQFRRGPLSAFSLQVDFPSNIKARFQVGDAVTGYEFTGGNVGLTGGRAIEFGGITGQVATAIIGSVHTDNNNGQLLFSTRGSAVTAERARITNNGNFLINTTTDAGYKLDVNGTARFSGQVKFDNSNIIATGITSQVANFQIARANTNTSVEIIGGATSVKFDATSASASTQFAGKVAIGSAYFTPTEMLHVNGSIKSSTLTLNGLVLATGGVLSSIAGYTGLFTVPTNPPGMQTLDIQNGIIVNVL